MESLVIANIKHRPMRTLVTAAGVAIGTVLILLIVGLAHGMMKERGARDTNMAAEIMVRPAGSFTAGLTSNSLSLPVNIVDKVRALPNVLAVAPLGQYIQTTDTGIGFRNIEAIDFDSYKAATGLNLIAGQPPKNDEEVIIDEEYASSHNLKPGGVTQLFDRDFKVAGIYSPQIGARIKVRLSMLQSMMAAENQCTMLLVRCQRSEQQEEVARQIVNSLPEVQVILTRDLPRLYSEGIPALNVFLKVLVALAVFVSTLVILLAMYTAITERTREIGVLKSLGASRLFIIWAIEKEALAISLLGVGIGYLLSTITKFFLIKFSSLRFIEFETTWLLITLAVGLAGGLVGALYPAYYAARQDPVEALSYE